VEVQIETQNVDLPRHAGAKLRQRVRKAMSHVGQHVSRMQLTLRDVNGAKGGCDKVCTIRRARPHYDDLTARIVMESA
jgi:hypothetical protein